MITWAGSWNGRRAQVRTIVDTLATRAAGALVVGLDHRKVDLPGTFDMMVRPGSATTFSNFDHLPYTLPPFAGLPAEAVVRTDRKGVRFPQQIIADHLDLFAEGRAKELLITPNGVRIVWPLAEADRARDGVFRQAESATPNSTGAHREIAAGGVRPSRGHQRKCKVGCRTGALASAGEPVG